MKIRLPWGQEAIDLDLPETWTVITPRAEGAPPPDAPDEEAIVSRALADPVGAAPLAQRDLAGKRVLIVTDDNTRPTPVARFFHLVLAALEKAGAQPADILVMPALGIHTAMSEAEMAAKIGPEHLGRVAWRNHDAFDAAVCHEFGVTPRGTPVVLNRAVAEADVIVSLGLIEPHLWAGFGGGLKNILPGLASAACIGAHHSVIAEPPYLFNRVGMAPEANSFRLDLEAIRPMIDADIFCLNVALNAAGGIIGAFAGDPVAAHRAGVAFNQQVAGRHLDAPVDGIIVNSHPMDINFKQSMKCVGNSLPALRPRGVVMGFLRAERGIDDIVVPEKGKPLWLTKTILRLLGPGRVMGFLEKIRPGLNVEEKFLLYYSMQLVRQYDLFFHVPSLSDDEVQRLGFFKPCAEPQQVIAAGRKALGAKARVAVFAEGGATFPIVGAAPTKG
jgi:nickel-dependent lactate racemase